MSDVLGHSAIPPLGWHGARIETGLDSAKGTPEILGQLYYATDIDTVYIAKDDLSGWDTMVVAGGQIFYGIQTTRTPALSVSNNTNTDINHTSDTTVLGASAIKSGTGFIVPTGKGGIWQVSASGRWNPPSAPGNINMSINNTVGSSGGVAQWDGSIIDTTKNHAFFVFGLFNWPAGTTFNLRAFQVTGASQTLQHYTLQAVYLGA